MQAELQKPVLTATASGTYTTNGSVSGRRHVSVSVSFSDVSSVGIKCFTPTVLVTRTAFFGGQKLNQLVAHVQQGHMTRRLQRNIPTTAASGSDCLHELPMGQS